MDKNKYEQVIAEIAKAKLAKSLKGLMGSAEDAWQAQRQAIRLIDWKSDEMKGEKKLKELQLAINKWIIELEILIYDAQKIARRANQALHTGGRHDEFEEDSQGHGDDTGGLQAP